MKQPHGAPGWETESFGEGAESYLGGTGQETQEGGTGGVPLPRTT